MATSFKVNKLWDVASLRVNSTGVTANGILGDLKDYIEATTANHLVTAKVAKTMQEAIEALQGGTLEYKKVAYVPANKVKETYAKEEYHNKILLVPSSPETTEGQNKYTEYLIVKSGTDAQGKDVYDAERLGEIGIDTTKITQEIQDINDKIGTGFSKEEGKTIAEQLAAEANRAKGVEGTLTSLTTDAKGNLVAAINEVDAHADAAATAVETEETRAKAAEEANAAAIGAEKERAEAAESDLQDAIDAEKERAEAAEKTLTDNLAAEVTRAKGVEGTLTDLTTDANGNLVAAINEVDAHADATATLVGTLPTEGTEATTVVGYIDEQVAAEKTRAEAAESGLDARLETVEEAIGQGGSVDSQIDTKIRAIEFTEGTQTNATAAINHITGTNNFTVDVAVANATGSAEGVVTLSDAIDSDSAASASVAATPAAVKAAVEAAATDASTKANARLGTITGSNGGGVSVTFSTTTDTAKTVTTTVAVTESTLDENSKFASDDKNVATGAKVQAAIDAAEKRAKDAQTYTADEVTIHVDGNEFSAKTGAVAADAATLTTGGQVHTAIETAKAALIGTATTADTIKKAQATADSKVATINSSEHITAAPVSDSDHTTYTISVKENSVLDMIINAMNRACTTAGDTATTEDMLAVRLGKLFQFADELTVIAETTENS